MAMQSIPCFHATPELHYPQSNQSFCLLTTFALLFQESIDYITCLKCTYYCAKLAVAHILNQNQAVYSPVTANLQGSSSYCSGAGSEQAKWKFCRWSLIFGYLERSQISRIILKIQKSFLQSFIGKGGYK